MGSTAINTGAYYFEEKLVTKQDPDSEIRTFLNNQGGGRYRFRFRTKSTLKIGDTVPDFKLISTTGDEVSLSDYTSRGKPVVIFFRPGFRFYGDKFEVQAFSRASPILKDLGVNVVGITSDPIQAQAKSARASNAPFLLLQDTDSEVASKYGATVKTDYNMISSAPATDRKTFIVGPDGKLLKVYPAVGWELNKVSAIDHVIEICAALGADPEQVREALNPRQRSIGEFLQYANGVPAETKEKLQTNEVPFDPFRGGIAGLR
jgi:peroxiredoxin Q/BCP